MVTALIDCWILRQKRLEKDIGLVSPIDFWVSLEGRARSSDTPSPSLSMHES